jgi:hypothetical protein
MAGFSDYWENEILDHLFDKGWYAPPAAIYLALSTADPGDMGLGAAEPPAGSYTRVETSKAHWAGASGGAVCNANAIEFAQATSAWGTITHFALYDAALGGNLLACGLLTEPATVAAGDTLRFEPGDLTVTLG